MGNKQLDMQIKNIGNSCGIVYHYTKLANATNIITKDGIVFRASRYDSMNDPNDSIYGALSAEKEMGCEIANAVTDTYIYNISPYIVSFCQKDDMPLMWRLYEAEITLHIDSRVIKNYCLTMSNRVLMKKVEYFTQDQCAKKMFEIFKAANNSFNNQELDFAAKANASFIKPKDFDCEKEWRIAWFDDYDILDKNADMNNLCSDNKNFISEIKSKESKYGKLAFFRELTFPKECFKGVTIRAYRNSVFEIIRMQLITWLAQSGYDMNSIEIYKTNTHCVR